MPVSATDRRVRVITPGLLSAKDRRNPMTICIARQITARREGTSAGPGPTQKIQSRARQTIVHPPSMKMVWPVVKLASSDAR
jgi:hypothetical protein